VLVKPENAAVLRIFLKNPCVVVFCGQWRERWLRVYGISSGEPANAKMAAF